MRYAMLSAAFLLVAGCGGDDAQTPEPETAARVPEFDDDIIDVVFHNVSQRWVFVDWSPIDVALGTEIPLGLTLPLQAGQYLIPRGFPEGSYMIRWTYDLQYWNASTEIIRGNIHDEIVLDVGIRFDTEPNLPSDPWMELRVVNRTEDRCWAQYRETHDDTWYLLSGRPITQDQAVVLRTFATDYSVRVAHMETISAEQFVPATPGSTVTVEF